MTNPRRTVLFSCLAWLPTGALAGSGAIADQLVARWIGGTSNWNNAANWSDGVIPHNSFPNTFNVLIDDGVVGLSVVTLDINRTIDKLTVDAGEELLIENNRGLTVVAGAGAGLIDNGGEIALQSTGLATELVLSGGTVTLMGGGTVSLGGQVDNRIRGVAASDVLDNVDNVIEGAGQVGLNLMGLTNGGTIVANLTNPLTIDPSTTGVVNTGTLRAADGGTLVLQIGTFTNAGATIEALDGSVVVLNSAVVEGGVLQTFGTGVIRSGGIETLDGTGQSVTLAGAMEVLNGDIVNLQGDIVNQGTISLQSTAITTELRCDGATQLSGGGTIILGDVTTLNQIIGVNVATLTNVDNTIRGTGLVGANSMAFDNQSLIVADGAGGLTIDPNTGGMTNSGTLRAEGGAVMQLNSAVYSNDGGVIEALDGSIVALNGATIAGGLVQSVGSGMVRTMSTETLDGDPTPITLAGAFDVRNGDTVNLSGAVQNTGVIQLSSTGGLTDLVASGASDVVLSGGGAVMMGDHANNRIRGTGVNLVNVDNTIEGAGNVGVNTMGITNQSLIEANLTNLLVVDPSAAGMVNTGTLRAGSGATLELRTGTYSNVGGVIEALDGSTVTLTGATIAGGGIQTVGSGLVQTTSSETLDGDPDPVELAGLLRIRNADNVTVLGGLANGGTLEISSTGSFTDLIVGGVGDVLFTGGGEVHMGNHINNRIRSSGGILVNVDNVIHGAGAIGLNAMTIENQALILADASAALTIDPDAGGMVNTGTLRAESGGVLQLNAASYDNLGGLIEALDASFVQLSGATIVGGSLQTSGSGLIRTLTISEVLDGDPDPVTLDGTLLVQNSDAVTIMGTIQNLGEIELGSTAGFTDLIVGGGGAILTGGGQVTLGANVNNRIRSVGGDLVNFSNLIHGAGQIGVNSMSITNQGAIIADAANALTIDPDSAGVFDNQGVLQAAGAGALVLAAGGFTTSGAVTVLGGSQLNRTGDFVQTGGLTIVDGSLSATGIVDIQGGALGGGGTVSGDVTNAGVVGPGASTGILTLNDDFTQAPTGTLHVEIGGLAAGTEYDRLVVAGTATLDGTLEIEFVNGFTGAIGDSFTVMTFASRAGDFATIAAPCLVGGKQITVSVSAVDVVVSVAAPINLDMNCDCIISIADAQAFATALVDPAEYGISFPGCDIDLADVDDNGQRDALDIAAFLGALLP